MSNQHNQRIIDTELITTEFRSSGFLRFISKPRLHLEAGGYIDLGECRGSTPEDAEARAQEALDDYMKHQGNR